MPHLLVTGGSRRLGLHITQHYLRQNWRVTVLTRESSEQLNELKQDNLTIIAVGDYQSDALTEALDTLKTDTIDLIVHNASRFEQDETDPARISDQLNRLMMIHVTLPTMINTVLTPALRRSENACIVHMSDIYVMNPDESRSHYCASKAALENLSLSFAKKLAPDVRVTSIQPGALMFLPEHDQNAQQQVLEKSLLQTESGFDPVLQTLDFLVRNPFITGSPIRVDGGRAICR